MLRNCFCLAMLSIVFIACNSNNNSIQSTSSKFLNRDSLPSQYITIDNSKDTVVTTANGALIKIEKGSFSKDNIQLEIKEAYSIEQMILSGLTTQSDDDILGSGGMIYVNTVDKDVELNKPVNISLPTNFVDETMMLYKGEEKDGKVNWTKPEALPKDSQPYLLAGKRAFQLNCGSCHAYEKILNGPAMQGLESRGPWGIRSNLHRFVQNPAAFIATNCYARQLQRQFNGQIMPAYPYLGTGRDSIVMISENSTGHVSQNGEGPLPGNILDAIFDYIKSEDLKRGIDLTNNFDYACDDSCRVYDSLYRAINNINQKLSEQREALIKQNGERINFDRNIENPDIQFNKAGFIPPRIDIEKVQPVRYQSIYYKFDIKTFGWYNIDVPMGSKDKEIDLSVETKGTYKDSMSVFIVIPKYKVFVEGGPLSNQKNIFGFYKKDGKIPLATGTKVIVFAVGEKDGEFFFDYKKFTSSETQRIGLEPKPMSKKDFNQAVKKFRLSDATIEVNDSKNAAEIRKADQQIKNNKELLELYRPKNCKCDCFQTDMPVIINESPGVK